MPVICAIWVRTVSDAATDIIRTRNILTRSVSCGLRSDVFILYSSWQHIFHKLKMTHSDAVSDLNSGLHSYYLTTASGSLNIIVTNSHQIHKCFLDPCTQGLRLLCMALARLWRSLDMSVKLWPGRTFAIYGDFCYNEI